MTDYSIDTLSTAENLKASGVSVNLRLKPSLRQSVRHSSRTWMVLITKGDLRNVEAGLKSDL
jgi:hypothetical protein